MDGVDCAIKKVAEPPASCQACANAKQRIAWPVPISGLASARIRIFPGVISALNFKLPPPFSTLQLVTVLAFREKPSARNQYRLGQESFPAGRVSSRSQPASAAVLQREIE